MDGVASLYSQGHSHPSGQPERWQVLRSRSAQQVAPSTAVPLSGASGADTSPPPVVPPQPQPVAPPTPAALPPPSNKLPVRSQPGRAPLQHPSVAPTTSVAPPVPSSKQLARAHRRRYTLQHPFSPLHPRPKTRRSRDYALPGRLADLVREQHAIARLTHRLGRNPVGWLWFCTAYNRSGDKEHRACFAEVRRQGASPMVALVLGGLLVHAFAWQARHKRAQLVDGLGLLNTAEALELQRFLFNHPSVARRVRQAYMVQERLELHQAGDSFTTFRRFMRHLGRGITVPKDAAAEALLAGTPNRIAPAPLQLPDTWRAHGRTVHFTGSDGVALGLKLKKSGSDALEREDLMDQCFAQWKPQLGLKSEVPRSRGMLWFDPDAAVRASIAAQAEATGEVQFGIEPGQLVPALLYETPPQYHVHLHEVDSIDALWDASYKALHDAGMLAGRFALVHMSPADFYHNREKGRRWYWNVDDVGKAVMGRVGTGRLDRVDVGVQYCNIGPTGWRDPKHWAFVDEIASEYSNNRALALTSTMGDYLLAWTLTVCKWFKDRDALEDIALSQVLQDGFVTYFAAYTQRPEDASRAFLKDVIDWPLLARQARYFLSNEYVPDVIHQDMPRHMFNKLTVTKTSVPEEGWDRAEGWMLDGKHRDLGPKNGPFPLTELVAALYITTGFAAALRT